MSLLEQLGYYFDNQGTLLTIQDNQKFKYESSEQYELVCQAVMEMIQQKLKDEFHMQEIWIPANQKPQCNIFLSEDFYTNQNICLILIAGTGGVQAGQWSRSVCINNSLTIGSVIPFIERAQKQQWSYIILNPLYNKDPHSYQIIKKNETTERHCQYVWTTHIMKCVAKQLLIVAHGSAGNSVIRLMQEYEGEFFQRVKAVAFSDSDHYGCQQMSNEIRKYLREKTVDFQSSDQKIGECIIQYSNSKGCAFISSGHKKFEFTIGTAINEIFQFFQNPQQYIIKAQQKFKREDLEEPSTSLLMKQKLISFKKVKTIEEHELERLQSQKTIGEQSQESKDFDQVKPPISPLRKDHRENCCFVPLDKCIIF